MNFVKRILFKLFLLYERHFPIQRGKFFVSKIITAITGEVNVQTRERIWLSVLPYSQMDRSYFSVRDESHMAILNEIRKLEKGSVFVDIGANIGFYSFAAAKQIGTEGLVYSFEPSKREYERLLHGQRLNNVNNLVTFNMALSDTNSLMAFDVNEYHTGLNKFNTDDKEQGSTKVPVFRGDQMILVDIIQLVKIDVEGAEFKVLQGLDKLLKSKSIKKLIVEITPSFLEKFGSSKDELYQYMKNHDYTPQRNLSEWQYDEIFMVNGLD
jgi:FkbM family methyltransferase